MKKSWEDEYEIPDEIDFSTMKWIRNPFVQNFRELNLVSLDSDVKAAFPDSESVNTALRQLMGADRETRKSESSEQSELPKAS